MSHEVQCDEEEGGKRSETSMKGLAITATKVNGDDRVRVYCVEE